MTPRARTIAHGLAVAFLSTTIGPLSAATASAAVLPRALARSSRRPRAQDHEATPLEVRVLDVSGDAVYVDRGRAGGLALGDELLLLPPGRAPVRARVAAIARTSARVLVLGPTAGLEEGVVGRLDRRAPTAVEAPDATSAPTAQSRGDQSRVVAPLAPRARTGRAAEADAELAADEGAERGDHTEDAAGSTIEASADTPATGGAGRPEARSAPPAHPPWRPESLRFDPNAPLLATTPTRAASERDPRWWGSLAVRGERSEDRLGDDRRYQHERARLDLGGDNPFGHGGELRLDLEFESRTIDVEQEGGRRVEDVRVDQLSYTLGGRRDHPWRLELGRFHQDALPELGRLDGLEWQWRHESGNRTALSVGAEPEREPALAVGDDTQVALSHRLLMAADETSALTLGYQHTEDGGDPDRDLVVADAHASIDAHTSLFASVWIDHYGRDAEVKDEGFELTRWHASASRRFDGGHRLRLFASHFRYPEIERYRELPAELLANGHVDRAGVAGRFEFDEDWALLARLDHWSDERRDGGAAEIGLELRDAWPGSLWRLAVFERDGSYSDSAGLRVRVDQTFRRGRFQLAWTSLRYEPVGLIDPDDADADESRDETLRAGLVLELTEGTDLDLYAARRFTDDGDAQVLGFEVLRRF